MMDDSISRFPRAPRRLVPPSASARDRHRAADDGPTGPAAGDEVGGSAAGDRAGGAA